VRALREKKIFPYVLIAPNALIFLIFIIVPACFGFYFSLTEWKGIGTPEFVGFANYIKLFSDAKFWRSFTRTCIHVAISLPLIMAVPLLLASLMVKEIKARGFFRAAFYWPSMISYIVVGISFKFIFGDNTGIINYLLSFFNGLRIEWMTNQITAMFVLVLATVWCRSGFYMVTYISGLQSVPLSYYEAAKVDGASGMQQFLFITLPLIKPTTFLVMILGLIDLFKAYGLVISLTGGGPGTATKFVVQYVYEKAFRQQEMGYASALSMVLLVVMAGFTILQFKINKGGRIDE
jgi:alpha-1,4-digalacturonate transport system permease protein